jgi:predicted nucleotidyltransferase
MNIQSVEKVKRGLSQELLQEIIDVIVRQVHPSRILLYGSRARSHYTVTSDVDIAIDCGEDDFLIQPIDEEVRTLLKLDIINLRKVNKRLQDEIATDGIVIYEKV